MAVLQMQRVSICALKKDRKAILEKLQALGVLEMNQIADEEGFVKMDTVRRKHSLQRRRWVSLIYMHRRSSQCCPG